MCLKYVTHPKQRNGFGYKVVRKVKDGVYHPYFKFFLKGDGGTLTGHKSIPSHMRHMVLTTNTQYILNDFTRARTKRLVRATNGQLYIAGIHLWWDLEFAKQRLQVLKILDDGDPSLTIIKCYWASPIASDDSTVVASRIKPIQEIDVGSFGEELCHV